MINESRLAQAIIGAMDFCQQENTDPNASKEYFAKAIAKAVIVELKSAEITGVCPSGGGTLLNGKIT